jgi:glycosyltransferase involved in cell wall biosynthesis
MKFTIIIPTYNEAKVVAKTLPQYAKAKDHFDLELIVADGGSTDETLKIAEKYADHIAYKKEKAVETIAHGRNRGAALASGDVLIFFDADIIVSSLPLLLQAIELTFRDQSVVAGTARTGVYPEERVLADRIFAKFFWWYVIFLNLIKRGAAKGECQIIRRSVFKKLKGYKDSLGAGEDFELFGRLAKIGTIRCLPIDIYESPRRYRKVGYPKIMWLWSVNAIMALSGRPVDKWPTVR